MLIVIIFYMGYSVSMNFSTLIKELKQAGLSQTEISQQIGCDQSYISRIQSGVITDPGYSYGVKLVEIHRRRVVKHKRSAAK